MTSLRDQFSAVRKAQFEAQFDFFHAMTTQALDSAGRVAALNMALSRDAVQRSLGAACALMNARDPREVLSIGGQAEEQMRSLFSYSRELLGIAGGMRPYTVRPHAPALAPAQAIETVEVIERGAADAGAAAVEAVEAAEAASAPAPVGEPVVVAEAAPEAASAALAEPVPVAEPKAIAKAAGKGAPRAAAAAHPAAAPVAELAPAPASRRKK